MFGQGRCSPDLAMKFSYLRPCEGGKIFPYLLTWRGSAYHVLAIPITGGLRRLTNNCRVNVRVTRFAPSISMDDNYFLSLNPLAQIYANLTIARQFHDKTTTVEKSCIPYSLFTFHILTIGILMKFFEKVS